MHVIRFFGLIYNIFSIISISLGSQGFIMDFKSNQFFISFFVVFAKFIGIQIDFRKQALKGTFKRFVLYVFKTILQSAKQFFALGFSQFCNAVPYKGRLLFLFESVCITELSALNHAQGKGFAPIDRCSHSDFSC